MSGESLINFRKYTAPTNLRCGKMFQSGVFEVPFFDPQPVLGLGGSLFFLKVTLVVEHGCSTPNSFI